jgi:hypothetical protein
MPPPTVQHELALSYAQHAHDALMRALRLFTPKPMAGGKPAMAAWLAEQIAGPGLARVLELAGEDGRRILAAAAHGCALRRIAGRASPGYRAGSWSALAYPQHPPVRPDPLILCFPDDQRMPEALRARLRPVLAAPSLIPLTPAADPAPDTVLGGDVVHDLGLLLALAGSGELTSTATGRLPKPLAKRLAAASGGPAELAALRWQVRLFTLRVAGFLASDGVGYTAARPTCTQADLRALLEAWYDDQEDDLDHLNGLIGHRDLYALTGDPVARRRELCVQLGRLPPGVWLQTQPLIARLAAQAPLEPLLGHSYAVELRGLERGSFHDTGEAGLNMVRDGWIRWALAGPLAGLGLVEVAQGAPPPLPREVAVCADEYARISLDWFTAADQVVAVRLTALGAWLLGDGPEPAAEPNVTAGGWRIQADGTIIALAATPAPAERLLVERLATPENARTWRLARPLLQRAVAEGLSGDVLCRRLQAMHGSALPDPILRQIADAARRAGAVEVLGERILLRIADAGAAAELAHDRRTRALVEQLAPGLLAVRPADLARLRRAALAVGWSIPALAKPSGEPPLPP